MRSPPQVHCLWVGRCRLGLEPEEGPKGWGAVAPRFSAEGRGSGDRDAYVSGVFPVPALAAYGPWPAASFS